MIVNINDRGISIRRYIVYLTKGSPVANNDRAFFAWTIKYFKTKKLFDKLSL